MHSPIPHDFAAFIGILVLEMILSGLWVAPYFRYGIPIYFKTVPFCAVTSSSELSALLSGESPPKWSPSQVFHPISDNQLAFREKVFESKIGVRYFPIMHGLIVVSPLERSIVVKGFLNWDAIALSVVTVNFAVSRNHTNYLGLAFFFGLIVIPIYFMQARAYKRIVEILRDRGQLAKTQP